MFRMAAGLLWHPSFWWEGLRAMWSMRSKSGWIPEEYLRWRVGTVYGDPTILMQPDDLRDYLAWRRRQRKLTL